MTSPKFQRSEFGDVFTYVTVSWSAGHKIFNPGYFAGLLSNKT